MHEVLNNRSSVSAKSISRKSGYLYGLTDSRAPKNLSNNENDKERPMDFYKFQIHPELEGKRKIIRTETKLRFHRTPNTLVELTGNVLDKLQLPYAFNWTCIDVVGWIDKLGYPQYRNTFYQNFINGRTLIFVDASILTAMNIINFSHIKEITKSINELYGIEMILFIRSISLPIRYPFTHFRFYNGQTGPKYNLKKITELFRKMKLLRPPPTYDEHWAILEKYLKHYRPIDIEKFGYARHCSPKSRIEKKPKKKPKPKTELGDWVLDNLELIPKENRKPWTLAYLRKREPLLYNSTPEDPHFVGCNCTEDMPNCNCKMFCLCSWPIIEFDSGTKTFEALRKFLYKKYELIEYKHAAE